MATDFHVYIFYQYNGKRPPEDGSTAKNRHPEIMKYSAESGQCWLRPGVGLDIHATKMKKYQTLLGFGLQVTWPSPVAVPIKLPWPFLLRTVLIVYVIAVDGYVNHSSETLYRLVEIPFSYLRNNLFLIFKWFIPVVCDYNIKYQNVIRWVSQNTTLY